MNASESVAAVMKHDRQWQIKRLFLQEKQVSTKELCARFNISVETARRDLNALEQSGMVRRIYGGAVLAADSIGGIPDLEDASIQPWDTRFTQNLEEKRAIAKELLRWIPDNSTLALDSGTSVLEAAKLLYLKKNLTILTNDMRIALELSSNTDHTLYFIGGAIKKDDMITTGFLSNEFLDYFSHIDLAIIGTDGFSVNIGLTDYNVEMGTLKAAMIKKSSKVFVLADHSKFSVNAFYKVCGVDKIDLVVTSGKAPRESLEVLERQGAKTVIAPCGQS